MRTKKEIGSLMEPKLRIRIGVWYLEIGKVVEIYTTAKQLIKAIQKETK